MSLKCWGSRIKLKGVSRRNHFLFHFQQLEVRMFKNLIYWGTILGVYSQNFLDQVNFNSLESLRKCNRFFHLTYYFLPSFSSERGDSLNHLEKQDSLTPNIDLVIVMFFLDHLGRHILKCATNCGPCLENSCESKITKLCDVIFGNENILRLNDDQKLTLMSLCM